MNFANRVKQTTTATSTATVSLGSEVLGYRTLDDAIARGAADPAAVKVGDTVCFVVDDKAGKWEESLYTVTSGALLTRQSILDSSNGGLAETFAAGNKEAFCTVPASFLNGVEASALAVADAPTSADYVLIIQGGVEKRLPIDMAKAYYGATGSAVNGTAYLLGVTANAYVGTAGASGGGVVHGNAAPAGVVATATVGLAVASAPAPAQQTAYTVTRYDGGVMPLPASNIASGTTQSAGGSAWIYRAAHTGFVNVNYELFKVAPKPVKIASGWGSSNAVPPSLIVTGRSQIGDNVKVAGGYLAIQDAGFGSDASHSSINTPEWVWLSGTPGTYPRYFWVVALDAQNNVVGAICVNPSAPWNITVTA